MLSASDGISAGENAADQIRGGSATCDLPPSLGSYGWTGRAFSLRLRRVPYAAFSRRRSVANAFLTGVKIKALTNPKEAYKHVRRKHYPSLIMKMKILACVLAAPLFVTGCASIVDGGDKSVQINSNPEGAKVTVFDKTGREVESQTTPTRMSLSRAHGFLSGEDYKLVFELPGYYPYETHVKSTIDGWYFGNILFGGLLGLVIVDPATGDMFTLAPRDINCNLVSSATQLTPAQLQEAQLKANTGANGAVPVSSPKSNRNP